MPHGQKTCPSCKKTCGPRSHTCPHCGYQFHPGKSKTVTAPATPATHIAEPEVTSNAGSSNEGSASTSPTPSNIATGVMEVLTPSGACPVKLTGTSPDEITTWREEVRKIGLTHQKYYSDTALDYWQRQQEEDYARQHKTPEPETATA